MTVPVNHTLSITITIDSADFPTPQSELECTFQIHNISLQLSPSSLLHPRLNVVSQHASAGLPVTAIVGATIGGGLFVLMLLLIMTWILLERRSRPDAKSETPEEEKKLPSTDYIGFKVPIFLVTAPSVTSFSRPSIDPAGAHYRRRISHEVSASPLSSPPLNSPALSSPLTLQTEVEETTEVVENIAGENSSDRAYNKG